MNGSYILNYTNIEKLNKFLALAVLCLTIGSHMAQRGLDVLLSGGSIPGTWVLEKQKLGEVCWAPRRTVSLTLV